MKRSQFQVLILALLVIGILGMLSGWAADKPLVKGKDIPLGMVFAKPAQTLPAPVTINGTTYTQFVVESIIIYGEDNIKIVYAVGKTRPDGKFAGDYIRVAGLTNADARSCLYRTFGKNVDKQAVALMWRAQEAIDKLAANPPQKGLKGQ